MFSGVALEEADAEVDGGYGQGTEPISPGEGTGVEVGANPGVVDDVGNTEEGDAEGD